MNSAKLGAYIAPTHDPSLWKDYLSQVQPPLVRILMPGATPTQLVSDVFKLCPGAKLSLRWWDVDDGGDGNKLAKLKDVATAAKAGQDDYNFYLSRFIAMKREAQQLGLPFPASFDVLFNAINEPPVQNVEMRPAIVAYNKAFVQEGEAQGGPNVLVGEISVGNPPEWPPAWDWFQPVIDAFEPGDMLALHEYWQPEGPAYEWTDEKGQKREDWGALAGRYQHVPFNVPIAITECGVDGRIYNRHQPPDTGYLKFMDPEHYSGQVGYYLAQLAKDKRIFACTPFEEDFQDKEWASFNTHPALPYFMKVLGAFNEAAKPVPPSGGTDVPPSGGGANSGGGNPVPPSSGKLDELLEAAARLVASNKPNDKSGLDRKYAIVGTELEKLRAIAWYMLGAEEMSG